MNVVSTALLTLIYLSFISLGLPDSVLGSAKLVLGCEEDPRDLARQVCSPGGTTIEGVTLLRDRRFEENVIDAIAAILRKDEILRKG